MIGVIPRCLGENISFIELDIPSLTDKQVEDLENEVNERILASIPVTPHLYHDKDDPELKQVSSCKILMPYKRKHMYGTSDGHQSLI